ncbi:MAG: hypothetical protein U1E73_06355 [Planctomycetota bacterium]
MQEPEPIGPERNADKSLIADGGYRGWDFEPETLVCTFWLAILGAFLLIRLMRAPASGWRNQRHLREARRAHILAEPPAGHGPINRRS